MLQEPLPLMWAGDADDVGLCKYRPCATAGSPAWRSELKREAGVRRRDLLKGAGATVLAAGMAPSLVRAEQTRKLVFVPTSDLTVLDPIVTFNRPTRNYSYVVFDTLYGIDTNWTAQPQMVEGHLVDEDGLIWTLKLRDGLRFHDNEPVLARDVVASIRRHASASPTP